VVPERWSCPYCKSLVSSCWLSETTKPASLDGGWVIAWDFHFFSATPEAVTPSPTIDLLAADALLLHHPASRGRPGVWIPQDENAAFSFSRSYSDDESLPSDRSRFGPSMTNARGSSGLVNIEQISAPT